jgi:hypothetical protein
VSRETQSAAKPIVGGSSGDEALVTSREAGRSCDIRRCGYLWRRVDVIRCGILIVGLRRTEDRR